MAPFQVASPTAPPVLPCLNPVVSTSLIFAAASQSRQLH